MDEDSRKIKIRPQTFSSWNPFDGIAGCLLTREYVHAIHPDAGDRIATHVVVYAGWRTLRARSQTWGETQPTSQTGKWRVQEKN